MIAKPLSPSPLLFFITISFDRALPFSIQTFLSPAPSRISSPLVSLC